MKKSREKERGGGRGGGERANSGVAPRKTWEGTDLSSPLSHRGMPASYFRPSPPFLLSNGGTFTRHNEIMKKGALCRAATIPARPSRWPSQRRKKIFPPSLPLSFLPPAALLFLSLVLFYDSWKNTGRVC